MTLEFIFSIVACTYIGLEDNSITIKNLKLFRRLSILNRMIKWEKQSLCDIWRKFLDSQTFFYFSALCLQSLTIQEVYWKEINMKYEEKKLSLPTLFGIVWAHGLVCWCVYIDQNLLFFRIVKTSFLQMFWFFSAPQQERAHRAQKFIKFYYSSSFIALFEAKCWAFK